MRLPRGAIVILRATTGAGRARLAAQLEDAVIARGLRLLVADDPALASDIGAAGLHLPEARLCEAAHWRARRPNWIVTGAVHSLAALTRAQGLPLDALLLSPVFSTVSHRHGKPLTPLRAAAIAAASRHPVYALGGITARSAARLAPAFDGIAAIGALL